MHNKQCQHHQDPIHKTVEGRTEVWMCCLPSGFKMLCRAYIQGTNIPTSDLSAPTHENLYISSFFSFWTYLEVCMTDLKTKPFYISQRWYEHSPTKSVLWYLLCQWASADLIWNGICIQSKENLPVFQATHWEFWLAYLGPFMLC